MTERDILQPSEDFESSSLEDTEKSRELEEATHEPRARVEESGDIQQAETIEANLVELVDTQSKEFFEGQVISAEDFEGDQEYHQEKEGEGGKSSFGTETSDPHKHYSGVKMEQAEVLQDDDWNEEEGIKQDIEAALDEMDHIREEGLEDLIDLQAAKKEGLEKEKDRLKDKFGTDTPRSSDDEKEEDDEEEEPPPANEEALALQMRMDKKDQKEQTLSKKLDDASSSQDEIVKNIK